MQSSFKRLYYVFLVDPSTACLKNIAEENQEPVWSICHQAYKKNYAALAIYINDGNTLPILSTIYVCRKLADIEAASDSSAVFWSRDIFEAYSTIFLAYVQWTSTIF